MLRLFRLLLLASLLLPFVAQGQTDSLLNAHRTMEQRLRQLEQRLREDTAFQRQYADMTFYYMQLFGLRQPAAQQKGLTISGYADVYYARYSDAVGHKFEQFPTSAPRNNSFGLNLAQLSARYEQERVRGVFTLHLGDIPQSAWSPEFNLVQEANLGLRLMPKLWLDAGFFRTHIGFESIQPRENITTSIATTTYYEPYFMSGAKLTYYVRPQWSVQLNAFNGFNTFVETNRGKAYGFSTAYEFTPQWVLTYNVLFSQEAPDGQARSQERMYHNAYMAFKGKHLDLGLELNLGVQQNSRLSDSTQSAHMRSALLALKYKLTSRHALYTRGEFFSDPDEMLTGPVENQYHQLVGLKIWGLTTGAELKPTPNSYFRLEGRYLHTLEDEQIFRYRNKPSVKRLEGIASVGVWF